MGSRVRRAKVARVAPLNRAVAALDAGDEPVAIEALCEAWRVRKSPDLAELVELIDARLAVRPFASLVGQRADTTIERLRAVEDSIDPRLSTVLLGMFANPPFLTNAELWDLVMTIAGRLTDPRLVPIAEAVHDRLYVRLSPAALRDRICKRFDHVVRQIAGVRQANAEQAALQEAIASRLSRPRAARQQEADVLAEIYRDPLADAPRLVYADLLLERGDPRGEFMALQFKRRGGSSNPEDSARERELLKRHMKEWLGGIATVVSNTQSYSHTTFERGFVAIADIYGNAERKLPTTWRASEWATVEELAGPFQHLVLENAPLCAIKRLMNANAETLAVAMRRPAQFANVETVSVRLSVQDLRVAECTLPALRHLGVFFIDGVTPGDVAWLVGAPIARRVARLDIGRRIGTQPEDHAQFAATVAALTALTVTTPIVGVTPPWTAWPGPEPIEFAAGPDGRYVRR